jgi:hypothetical protein
MAMSEARNDDWRTTVELVDDEHRGRFTGALRGRRLAREARDKLGDRVIVTHDGPRLFLYTDSEAGARTVADVAHELLEEHGIHGSVAVTRWHPAEERWEDAGVPLPATEEEQAAELARRGDRDRELSRQQGYPEWDVRLVFPTRPEALEFARTLSDEGIPFASGGSAIVVGAETEQDARALSERLRGIAPGDALISVEVNRAEAWNEGHPFAFLGGLGN